MPEPVICFGCGESLGDYPLGGKCPKCGAAIPTPARAPRGIEEELARLDGGRKACPTCGKPLPTGKSVCPFCRTAEEPRVRRGMPGWLALLLVLLFAAVAGTITVMYMQKWQHEKLVAYVREDLAKASEATKAGNFANAVLLLRKAQKEIDDPDWFKEEDPARGDLALEAEGQRKAIHSTAEDKLRAMIKEGEELEADKFYKDYVADVDTDGSLRDLVDKALANRTKLIKYRAQLKQAQKYKEDGQFVDALQEIHALRMQVQDPIKNKGLGDFRESVEKLQNDWVNESYAKGNALLDQGKLAEAATWYETARKYVWLSEVTLRRQLDDKLSYIAEKRVVGVVINVASVRVVKPEDVKADLAVRLKRKLGDEGFLMFVLAGRTDPKAAEIPRILVLDYKEDKTTVFAFSTGQKAVGTRITCALKLVSAADNKVLWEEKPPITAQTGEKGGGEPTDAALRQNALDIFWQTLDAVRIPTRELAP